MFMIAPKYELVAIGVLCALFFLAALAVIIKLTR